MPNAPLVIIPARFSETASALRHRAVVTARALSEAVLRAGGEPLTVHPWAPGGSIDPAAVAERFSFADAVLLPGGGDLSPATYGDTSRHDAVYDVDDEQDAFDLAIARWSLDAGLPTLAVCRGTQVVNVSRGGTLRQHMDVPHRPVVHHVSVDEGTRLAAVVGRSLRASCYHHQSLEQLGDGVRATAHSEDGTIEAIEVTDAAGWFLGLQWHPEDSAAADPLQEALISALVAEARR